MVVLAAGLSTRFGGGKQLAPVGPNGEALCDYGVLDAHRAGCRQFVFVIREDARAEFEAHIASIWGDDLGIRLAIQEMPPTLRRPWGTGHAVLAARHYVPGALVVINADDWYPARGYHQLADALDHYREDEHALITHRLDTTPMSAVGGVSRGVCEVRRDGCLHGVSEVREIAPSAEGYVGRGSAGEFVALSGSEPVSMNLWGFQRTVFEPLNQQFQRFVQDFPNDFEPEFLIGEAIAEQVRHGTCRVRVLDGGPAGFGMTFEEDLSPVRGRIESLVTSGHYPARIRDGLS